MKGKRVLAILISLVLTVGMLTVGTFAAEGTADTATTAVEAGNSQQSDADQQAAEAAKKAEEEKKAQEEATRKAEEEKKAREEAAKKAEEEKKAQEEAARKAEEEKKAREEAAKKAEEEKKAAEAAKKAEEDAKKAAEASNLSIGFEQITKESGKLDAGKGSIKYEYEKKGEGDKEKVILTLDKATLKANEDKGKVKAPAAAIIYTGKGTLVLSLKDENTVTGRSYAVYAPNATVKVTVDEKDKEKSCSLEAEAAPQNSNAIRGKKIVVDKPLEITTPESNYIFEGKNDDQSTYETVTVKANGRNIAATSVKIENPESTDAEPDASEKEKVEKTEDPEKEEKAEDTEKTETTENTEETEKAENTEETEKAENTEETEKAENTKDTDQDEKTEDTAITEKTEETTEAAAKRKLASPASADLPALSFGADKHTDASGSAAAGEGTIEYQREGEGSAEKVTVTLNKASFDSGTADAAISYEGEGELIIVLKGENSLSGKTYGIYAPKGTVTITGEKGDSLTASTAISTQVTYAVYAAKITPVEAPLVAAVTAPDTAEESTIADGENGEGVSYQTIAYGEEKFAAAGVKIEVPEYAVTFDANGGSGSMAEKETTVTNGEKFTLPKCAFTAPADKEFDQWQVNDENKYDPGDEVTITKTTTVKAIWKDKGVVVEKWKISFDANGGSGSMDERTVTKGEKFTLPKNLFTAPEGKDFDQWEMDGKKYAGDGKTSVEITKDTTVKATWKDHEWGEPTYSWAKGNSTCTATRKCKNCTLTEIELVKSIAGSTATCEKEGVIYYTAQFTNTAFAKQEKTTNEKQAALGHSWGSPEFSWSEDYTKATATFTCRRDKSHTQTVDAKVTGMITVPGKKKDGKMVYTATATLDGRKYTDKKEKPIAPAGDKGYTFTVPTKNKTTSWTKNSKNSLAFTIKRSEYDAMTFAAFDSLTVDGKAVQNKNDSSYTTAKGSLKLTFKPAYLNTLAAGTHTLKVEFKDGTVEKKFTVAAAGATAGSSTTARRGTSATGTGSPRTGDYSNWALWIGLIAVSAVGIGAVLFYRKRSKGQQTGE